MQRLALFQEPCGMSVFCLKEDVKLCLQYVSRVTPVWKLHKGKIWDE